MKTLVLNCGSSSLKFQLINTRSEELLAKGIVEKIGTGNAVFNYQNKDGKKVHEIMEIRNHEVALKLVINNLTAQQWGVLSSISEIEAIGHRVVHGGEKFSGSVLITQEVIESIKECSIFAPLHNPPNLMGIMACSTFVAGIDQVAVFDTAFHQGIPPHAYVYGLPYSLYEQLKIRRYGFHGTSHSYVAKKAAETLGRDYYNDFKVITAHLGNGASLAAVKNGVSIDTTMGFTPLEGLAMGTRCGDIDPAILPYVMEKELLSPKEIDHLMNKLSGLKGISKTTNDMREIEEEALDGSVQHILALDIFCYRVKKYLAAYHGILNGADAIVFTAGIGENSRTVREKVCEGLDNLGIVIDKEKNTKNQVLIGDGRTKVMVIPTNEELAIAHETYRVLKDSIERKENEVKEKLVKEELNSLTEAKKAAIAIFCAKNADRSTKELYDSAKKILQLKISGSAFEELLKAMAIR